MAKKRTKDSPTLFPGEGDDEKRLRAAGYQKFGLLWESPTTGKLLKLESALSELDEREAKEQ